MLVVYKICIACIGFYVSISDEVILPADQDCYPVTVIGDSGGVAKMIYCDIDKSSRDHLTY